MGDPYHLSYPVSIKIVSHEVEDVRKWEYYGTPENKSLSDVLNNFTAIKKKLGKNTISDFHLMQTNSASKNKTNWNET